ncbi:MAG: hypothetical protein IRY99_16405 [Isosphaeraceae bacterium]|nr:hypothetical protein [Isosphaeraceae bacterium]
MCLGLLGLPLLAQAQTGPVEVEPADLTRRPELIGREVIVDDRVQGLDYHQGRGWDEIRFQRTPVVFRLPPYLSFPRRPDVGSARLRARLRKEGERLVGEVVSLEVAPDDRERLARAIAALSPRDAKGRESWSLWARKRGAAFDDPELTQRAADLAAEAVQIEADHLAAEGPHASADAWLRLAQKARRLQAAEPEPSALAHRAYRALLDETNAPLDLDRLASEITAFFPDAKSPQSADVSAWETPYQNDPAGAYRKAPAEVRAALDRRLVADAIQKALEQQAVADPSSILALADQARDRLPDRPEVANRLEDQGLEAAVRNIGSLRRSEVEALARRFEGRHQPERARAVIRDWLGDQREKLSPRNAEDRVLLAAHYERLLKDEATAAALLEEALAISPGYRAAVDALRRLGYRQVGNRWVQSDRPHREPEDREPESSRRDALLGATRQEVRSRFGEPERICRIATQGQILEQWIYRSSSNKTRYLNFIQRPGAPEATVQDHYIVP